MRVAIVAPTAVPYVEGGAERLWRSLASGLKAVGHEAEVMTLPFPETTLAEVLDGYEAFNRLDLSSFDVVVSGKYPAWMVEHKRHVVYMLHPLRGLYDTYSGSLQQLSAAAELQATPEGGAIVAQLETLTTPPEIIAASRAASELLGSEHPAAGFPGALARYVVQRLDHVAFAGDRIKHFAAISNEVAERSGYFPAERAIQVVYPVSDLPSIAHPETQLPGVTDSTGPLFFTASRHDKPKRIDLIIKAFRHLTDGHNDRQLSLVIAGDGPERESLEAAAGANERIRFVGRLSEQDLASYYARADAVVFVPDREDFGYVTLEAMSHRTPVITTSDSGGAKELLSEGVGGVIVEPTVVALSDAFDQLADNPYLRWQLGLNGLRRARSISWKPLIEAIERLASETERARALVVSTFGIEPAVGGGQRRIRHLTRALAAHMDVTVLCLTNTGLTSTGLTSTGLANIRRRILEPGLSQIDVPRSLEHLKAEAEITRVAGFPVDDITCGRLWPSTPAFVQELETLIAESDVVISSHPFLAPAIKKALAATDHEPVVVYDSHNAETEFKTSLLQNSSAVTTSEAAAEWLIKAVTDSETDAVNLADHVTACTAKDLEAVISLRNQPDLGVPATPRIRTEAVVPNGVDASAMAQRSPSQQRLARLEVLALIGATSNEARPLAVFIGSWHPPNIAAANVITELAMRRPDWLFVLAGSHTLAFAQNPGLNENLFLLPTFAEETLWPLLAGADVALNPMLSGGGSNLKLYDYLSVGVPVLTSITGARGLDKPDTVVWSAEPNVADLATTLDEISSSPDERQRRSARGVELVASSMDWAELGEAWSQGILSRMAKPSTAASALPHSTTAPKPFVASDRPPPTDSTLELMQRLTSAAMSPEPPREMTTMSPSLRESLQRMRANRHAGRNLPTGARLQAPKRALIRAGHAITNEQMVFNEAAIDTVSKLTELVSDLSTKVEELQDQVTQLSPDPGDNLPKKPQ